MDQARLSVSDESDLEQVRTILTALQEGIGARAVAVFDDDLLRLHATGGELPTGYWQDLAQMPCLHFNWSAWMGELGWKKHVVTACQCRAGHAVRGFYIHGRWALRVVTHGPLPPGAQVAMFEAVRLLASVLPAHHAPRPRRGGRGPQHARIGATLRWVLSESIRPRRVRDRTITPLVL